MFKTAFFHGLIASVLSAIAAIIYQKIYFVANEADFSKVINYGSMIGFSFLVCLVATFIYYGLVKWLKRKGEIVFSFLFSIISFAAIMVPISINLPSGIDVNALTLFPGLAIPMLFFPAIAWFTIRPLFTIKHI